MRRNRSLSGRVKWLLAIFVLCGASGTFGYCSSVDGGSGSPPEPHATAAAARGPIEVSADYTKRIPVNEAWWQLLPANVEQGIPKGQSCDALRGWLRARGGIDRGASPVSIWIRALRPSKIRIVRIRSRLVQRRPIPRGRSLLCVPYDSAVEREDSSDLTVDRDGATAPVPSDSLSGEPGAASYDAMLSFGEIYGDGITAFAHNCDCSWMIELEIEVNGQRWRYTLGRGGTQQPFRTIATPANPADPRTTRIWCAVGGKGFITGPDRKDCPPPDDYETPLY